MVNTIEVETVEEDFSHAPDAKDDAASNPDALQAENDENSSGSHDSGEHKADADELSDNSGDGLDSNSSDGASDNAAESESPEGPAAGAGDSSKPVKPQKENKSKGRAAKNAVEKPKEVVKKPGYVTVYIDSRVTEHSTVTEGALVRKVVSGSINGCHYEIELDKQVDIPEQIALAIEPLIQKTAELQAKEG